MTRIRIVVARALLGLLLGAGACPVGATEVEEALRLIQAGQAEQAYQLLAPLAPAQSGDPQFDYLLGLAALDSGRPGEAVFALERVLAVQPDHARARAEIARAYFQLGEAQTARREFEAVSRQGVPPRVAEALQRYLNAIDQRVTGDRRQLRVYIEAAAGYDSNVNSGAGERNVAVPLFGGAILRLDDAGVENEDGFASVGAGVAGTHPLSERVDLVGGANIARRQLFSDTEFTTASIDAYAGLNVTSGRDVFTGALQAELFEVDDQTFRNAWGLVGGWNRDLGPRTRMSAFLQLIRLDYPSQDLRDSTRYVGGLGLSHAFAVKRTPVVYASAYGGTEDERSSGVPHLGHDLYGLRLGGQLRLLPQVQAYAAVNAEFRDYGGPEPFFLRTRDDTRVEAKLGFDFRPAKAWTVAPQLSYVSNDSNVVIYDYDRTLFAVTVRREFN